MKLDAMPPSGVIDGFRGTLDFYIYHPNPLDPRGIAVCRSWPTYNADRYPESSKVMQPFFSYINKMYRFLPPEIVTGYESMSGGTSLTPRDYAVRCYLAGDSVG